MKIRDIIKAPEKLAEGTQTALVISCIALLLAGIALFAAAHHTGGDH